jgi:membrane fusion protein (multidrug efflux system)
MIIKKKLICNTTKIKSAWAAAIIFCTIALFSCKKTAPKNPEEGPIPVNLFQVKEETPAYFDLYPGNILALNEVHLMSEVGGFITGIFFIQGQQVKKGQKLYEIEPERYNANYRQALANLKIAKSNFEKAAKDEERYTALGRMDAIAKQRVDYAHTDYKNAKQQVTSAQAEVVKASTDLQHSVIHAPFDGTIGISLVKTGTLASPGQTDLNTISSNDPMAVDFVISEKEIGRFQDIKNRLKNSSDSTFTIVLPNNKIYKYPGEIAFFDRGVDPQTGTLRIRLQFPNPDYELKPGMSCNVRVRNIIEKKSVIIPSKAVTEQMGEFFVYVVEKDTARQHKIVLGNAVKDSVIVSFGLHAGERIVIDGIQKLHDGSVVTEGQKPDMQKQSANK